MELQPLTLKPTKENQFNYEPSQARSAREVADLSTYASKTIVVSGQPTRAYTNGYGWFREAQSDDR